MESQQQTAAVLALWQALQTTLELKLTPMPVPAGRLDDLVRQGGAAGWQIEDLLGELNAPYEARIHWRDLALLAEVPVQTLLWRPSGRSDCTSGGDGLTLEDLTALLIRMESWGLGVDPAALVAAVLPTLKTKKLLTERELRALWWRAERHRTKDLARFPAAIAAVEWGHLALPSGYRAACCAQGLVIAGPKIGKRKWADTLLYLDLTPAQGWTFKNNAAVTAASAEM